jgi:copper resistance protein C
MTMHTKSVSAAVMAGVLLAAGGAWAHAHLLAADPAPGAAVKVSPRAIRATFSEELVGQFSALTLSTDKGVAVTIGKATLDPQNHQILLAPLARPLPPGGYTVNWRAVSTDTHHTAGHYSFRVLP